MSIQIVPQDELADGKTAGNIPPVLFANLKNLYQRRADRLRALAEDSPLDGYLNFAATICDAQQRVLAAFPLEIDLSEELQKAAGKPPLDCSLFPRTPYWLVLLDALIAELKPGADETVRQVLERLEHSPSLQREMMATQLLNQDFVHVPADKAPFIWAALSLYWAQMAAQLRGVGRADYGESRQFCPVCGSIPVSAVIAMGANNGLRYLHCNLCESEWHVVRAKCSNCDEMGNLHYWSLSEDSAGAEQATIKAEACDDCGAYLKVIYQDKDPQADAVADDLATLLLDDRMEDKGFTGSGVNPFLFPAG
ncbi:MULTISPECIES: formate dehydrogenase accessory protein FdhE [Rahnella]|uniref:Protein FdhE homolog n=1 Tax=Rahnella laticis TaxID=2787622 RepID=A0ABS0E6Z2_9GAMM|nr:MULTISPECIES: formate dehydrogenase accessory protein FdhE [Rahnella]MBF7980860.1 formate dehydrogenase accessory protein FdhE [Rahnella laticis]MBF8000951.1 formate dehydrogenase accessory protein FdhE [Rahnella sp. LAC-M12]